MKLVFLWLTSLGMIPSRSVHLSICSICCCKWHYFVLFLMAEQYFIIYMYYIYIHIYMYIKYIYIHVPYMYMYIYVLRLLWVSLVAQTVKNLPAMWESWVWSLGWEDSPEEGTATHSSILAWRIPMDRGAWQATVHEAAKSRTWLSD